MGNQCHDLTVTGLSFAPCAVVNGGLIRIKDMYDYGMIYDIDTIASGICDNAVNSLIASCSADYKLATNEVRDDAGKIMSSGCVV